MIERVTPSLRERVWGRNDLRPWFPPQNARTGEAWYQVSQRPDFPLVKLIFTSEKLSVQVHPDDGYARARHDSKGKTEMWHILEAEPGARIAAGFREAVTSERLRSAALSGEIEQMLEWHTAAAGDTFFIPAGTVHAIGAGIVLLEVQQNSDVTYRLYDYGRGRELHLDDGVKVSRGERHAARVTPAEGAAEGADAILECEYFSLRRLRVTERARHQFARPEMLLALAGAGSIGGEPVRPGEAWMVEGAVEIAGPVTLARIR